MGKVAVVTGAGSGIGKVLPEALVARGDHVVLADVDPAVQVVVKEVAAQGPGTTESAQLDVRDAEAVRGLVDLFTYVSAADRPVLSWQQRRQQRRQLAQS